MVSAQSVTLDVDWQKQTSHRGLLSLPLEVIDVIIGYVHLNSLAENADHHGHGLWGRRKSQLALVPTDKACQRYIMQLDHIIPILNSLQSLGAVNKHFHELCRPLLWKVIEFPTRLPIPISMWIKTILPRHGLLVRSLSVRMSAFFLKSSQDPFRHSSRYDNTVSRKTERCLKHVDRCNCFVREMLSPKAVAGILLQCPNLSTFSITFPSSDHCFDRSMEDGHIRGVQKFLTHLFPITPTFIRLRHLALHHINGAVLTDEVMSRIFQSLPLLESFTESDQTVLNVEDDWRPSHSGLPLSQLTHLSRLRLDRVASVDFAWTRHLWPQLITDLHLERCPNMTPSIAHSLVQHIAPHLTRLRLNLSGDLNYTELRTHWVRDHPFNLPELLELYLEPYGHDFLPGFKSCKKLRSIRCDHVLRADWESVQYHICTSTWPKLKSVSFIGELVFESELDHHEAERMESYERLLLEYCEQNDIHHEIHSLLIM